MFTGTACRSTGAAGTCGAGVWPTPVPVGGGEERAGMHFVGLVLSRDLRSAPVGEGNGLGLDSLVLMESRSLVLFGGTATGV